MPVIPKLTLSKLLPKAPGQDKAKILEVHAIESLRNEELEKGAFYMTEEQERQADRQADKRMLNCVIGSGLLMMLVLIGFVGILRVVDPFPRSARFMGYCRVPMQGQLIEKSYPIMPLVWTTKADVDAQFLNEEYQPNQPNQPNQPELLEQADQPDFLENTLYEQFHIGDDVETIMVFNGAKKRPTSIINDFSANISGIVDDARCFIFPLKPEHAMSPQMLLLNIQGNTPFDVSRMSSSMRIILPPLLDVLRLSRHIADGCANKHVYELADDDHNTLYIRKRSTDPVKADFKYFAGNRIQEIQIGNLQDMLAYEKKINQ